MTIRPEDPVRITSRDNVVVKDLRRLARDGGAYRRMGRLWLEGDHLCRAALDRGMQPIASVFAESFWPQAPARLVEAAPRIYLLPDALLAEASGLESPAPVGFLMALPESMGPRPGLAAVVLDRLQDPGNVGSILRSASAFGFAQVLALKGTVALWSPKVLRAGMGAHFGLQLVEGIEPPAVGQLGLPLLATSSHQGEWLHRAALPWPCAWLMGHEGQGVGPMLEAMATQRIRIAQPGGEESLNVAAAAAVCLHASAAHQMATTA
ncbi:RNA methyltransferase [Pseudacidovorax sp. RU35E]|uniref:TrmH family RNA methyltransferase n=1 Tax=Pseudacidovorax sp. RU35E TaxID=1907403 RepID=UPI0009573BE4|nr:RNA methyltransferase [Pseudacidovorax sp. RU35E]SIP99882.1 RNA methyltransferase, TrmH family [Pseudacidovorax sp. RU35E]